MSDEPSEDDVDRASRIRDRRKGRGSTRTPQTQQTDEEPQTQQTPEAEQTEQVDEEPQTQQSKQMNDDTQTATERSAQSTQSAQSAQTEQAQRTPQTDEGQQTQQTPVTERNHDTFYLTDDMRAHLDLGTDAVDLEYRRAHGTKLELNRHLRPLLLYLGLERLEEMDADEIRDTLADVELLDDPPE